MNNKGFAITTLVYGLSIMGILLISIIMATLSSTRKNIRELSEKVEQDLLNYSKSSVVATGASGYTVPSGEGGYYRIEAWGPQSSSAGGCSGSPGMYLTGLIELKENDTLVLLPGGCGFTTTVRKKDGDYETEIINTSGNLNGDSSKPVYHDKSVYDVLSYDHANAGGGKVVLSKVSPYRSYSEMAIDSDYWTNYEKISVTVSDPASLYKKDCSLTYNYSANYGIICENTLSLTSNSASGWPDYSYASRYGMSFNRVTLYCPSVEDRNERITFKIDAEYGSRKTTLYEGRYYTSSPTGMTLSPFQASTIKRYNNGLHVTSSTANKDYNLPAHGNYYIISANSNTALTHGDELGTSILSGSSLQKWSVDLLNMPGGRSHTYPNITNDTGKNEYQIVSTADFMALGVANDENISGAKLAANSTFNSLSRNDPQIWIITPYPDNTYTIRTAISYSSSSDMGCVHADNSGNVSLGKCNTTPTLEEKFQFYSISMSTVS